MKNKNLPYYYHYSDTENKIYSIDKMIISGNIKPKQFGKLLKYLKKKSEEIGKTLEVDTRLNHYHYMFQLFVGTSCIKVMIGSNGRNPLALKIEFNPNKTMDDTECFNILTCIYSLCDSFYLQFVDIACDIYIPKRKLHFLRTSYKNVSTYIPSDYKGKKGKNSKHKVNYEKITKDIANFTTEYLGTKGYKTSDGYCKLYNKTIEQMEQNGDDTPTPDTEMITRFEITLYLDAKMTMGRFYRKLAKKLPKLYTFNSDTDFSQYEKDTTTEEYKLFKKYEHHLRTLNDSDNPVAMLETLHNSKQKKYCKKTKAKLINLLNIHYIKFDISCIVSLYNDYSILFEKIENYEYENVWCYPDLFNIPLSVLEQEMEISSFDDYYDNSYDADYGNELQDDWR